MVSSTSLHHIQLHDFTIKSPLPVPKLLCHPSRLALKFSVNGVSENEMLSTRRDTEDGIWEVDGDVKICEDQLLTTTILICVEGSTKELGSVTVSYSQLLAHAEARSKECYEFSVDEPTSSILILVTCSIRTLELLPQRQHILAEPVVAPGKSKSDEERSGSNRALTPGASSIANLERGYGWATSLPVERRAQVLNAIGFEYRKIYVATNEMEHLERAISILDEALQNASLDPWLPAYLDNISVCLRWRFKRTGSRDDIEHSVSTSQEAVHVTKAGDPNRYHYILHHANALLERFECLGKVEDLQNGISFMSIAVELLPDGHTNKPICLSTLGVTLERRFERLGRVEDLEIAIAHEQKALNLMPDGHPDKPKYLSNLGVSFVIRFDRLSRVEDLEIAIAHKQKAVDLTPDGHPDKPGYLANLGTTSKTRFDWLGHLEDLEIAIAYNQKAIDLTLDGHAAKPKFLLSSGVAFKARFDRLGRIEDLEIAIVRKQKATNLIPDGHPAKPVYLTNLGNAFCTRFQRLGRVEDLEIAIAYDQKAVDLTPDGDPAKPTYFNNLGNVFQLRFLRLGRIDDLEIAIVCKQKAVDLTPDGHPAKPGYLNTLGSSFETQFDRFGRVEDLEIAIAHKQNAVDLTPDAHPEKVINLHTLGDAFLSRFRLLKQPKDVSMALVQYSTAALLPTAGPRDRLDAAKCWARTSEQLKKFGVSDPSPLQPYHVAIDLLPRIAWLGIPMSTQHALLEEVGGTVREAVFAAIRAGEYETAVEWAEAGRSIAWQNLLNLRTPISELRGAHYELADRLETISRQLDMSVRGGDGRMNDSANGMQVSRSHVQLALDWDNTVADIRSKPGFESFLKPKSFNQLRRVAHDGPVVILNIIKDRCDALVLIPEDNGDSRISNITLNGFSYAKGETLLKELKGLLSSKHLRARDCRKPRRMPIDDGNGTPLEHILRCIWLDVVKPIIDTLAYQPRSTDLPHIWWCATGPLAFLPIHAAGLYDTNELGSKLSDYVVSSYTPTLSALLDDSTPSQEDFRLLAIAQANAPGASSIPMTEVELKKIQTSSQNISVTTMTKEDATVENVWNGMEESSWVHLACHGHQNIKEPMKSGLLLHDGTLELQRLIEKPLPLADFAFLSACQTATGDESVAEESLHLAAGMLFAGYKGVIATMWSIMDDVGPRVAEDVYRVMLKDGKPNRKAAAHALHEAVRRLREDPKVDMLHWVPFIHIGL